jgi:septal ring factor EnvC (AmiA/AmiB activator)
VNEESIVTATVAFIAALFSNKAWDHWTDRNRIRQRQRDIERDQTLVYRDDLRDEIQRLRDEISNLYTNRVTLQDQIIELKEHLAIFKARVEYLEKENRRLKRTS